MRIGFSGTRRGMSPAQMATVRELLTRLQPTEVHHGDCVGADAHFHNIVRSLYEPEVCPIVIHPGPDGPLRAHKDGDEVLPEKNHFARNRDIVRGCGVLIATPAEAGWQPRGGTWYTIDFAAKVGRRRFIVSPDGTVWEEE